MVLTKYRLRRRYLVKTMLHCLRQYSVFVREDLETTAVSGAVFNALFLATHCF
jgi:hypothetical protein